MKEEKDYYIELRSEEVQELMGQVPHWILRWGIILIGFLMAGLLTGSYFFKYPDVLNASITIPVSESIHGYASLPATGAGKLQKGQIVKVRLANFPDAEYGYLTGRLDSIAPMPDPNGNHRLVVCFPQGLLTNYGITLPLTMQLTGSAEIITKDKRLIENLIHPIQKILKE